LQICNFSLGRQNFAGLNLTLLAGSGGIDIRPIPKTEVGITVDRVDREGKGGRFEMVGPNSGSGFQTIVISGR